MSVNLINLKEAKGLFVTGTGTDIGKTYVTGLLLKYIRDNGYNACYYKAALSGAIKNENNKLIPGDATEVLSMANLDEDTDFVVPYIYETPVSPHLAAKIENIPIEMDVIKESYLKVATKYDYVLMEGSGGIVCPIRYDDKIIFLEDIIKELGLAVVLVADAGLGTINSIVTSSEYIRNRGISIVGIILNNYHNGSIMEEDNIKMIESILNIPIIAKVAENDKNLKLDISPEDLIKYFG